MSRLKRFLTMTLTGSAALLLSACAHHPEVLPTPKLIYTCPRVKNYPQVFLNEVARETETYGKEVPALVVLSTDYSSMRKAARACQKDASTALVDSSTLKSEH